MRPCVWDRNWLIARAIWRNLEYASTTVSGLLLDVGCGSKPYTSIFLNRVVRYIGTDVPFSPLVDGNVDVYSNALALPFRDESLDALLATEVLHQLSEPEQALREMNRVLKEGGVILLTTIQMWPVHNEPYDCYRYTQHGLRHLFRKSGFEIQTIRSYCGFHARVGLKLSYFFHRFLKVRMLFPVIKLASLGVQGFFGLMDYLFYTPKDVTGHMVVAKKERRLPLTYV